MEEIKLRKGNGVALIPFFIFIISFLGVGIIENDFYVFKSPNAAILGIIAAFILLKGNANKKIEDLITGCGNPKIITMCLIYLLAGAFAVVSKAIGGVDAVVNAGLYVVPVKFLAGGVFLIAAFVSTSIGTSVGSIVAMGPIVVGLADKSGQPLPMLLGALLCGAMFGDNLSIISDTTIAATKTQGVSMKDKFKVNIFIALPAAVLFFIWLLLSGANTAPVDLVKETPQLSGIIPYLMVLVLAISGMNVFLVLVIGTLIAAALGIIQGAFGWLEFSDLVYGGFTGMTEIFLLSLLTGGLAHMVNQAGGLDFLIYNISKAIKGKKTAKLGIGMLTGVADLAVANNTVAILIVGDIVRSVAQKYEVKPRQSAAIMDVFSCIGQGLIPYGAQVLIMLSFTNGSVAFFDLLPFVGYFYLLFISSIMFIRFSR